MKRWLIKFLFGVCPKCKRVGTFGYHGYWSGAVECSCGYTEQRDW